MEKKNLLTYEGLQKLETELHDLKVVKRKEVAQKIKEAREQGDLSENAEYDAAKDEQRDIEARIEEIEKIMADDSRIVELRRRVRKVAESQLENGVIDATSLLDKITAESQASLTQAYHGIQRIQYIYQLKYTLNQ